MDQKPNFVLTTNQTEELEVLLEAGWELLVFKAHPRPEALHLFTTRGGVYGAGFVDTSGDVPSEIEDYEYSGGIQESVEKALKRWKEEEK